jgi:hypothetical protein
LHLAGHTGSATLYRRNVDKIFDALGSLLSDLSLRRLVGVVFLAAICGAGVLGYERLTSTFRLQRIERMTELVRRLRSLDSSQANDDPVLRDIRSRLKADLRAVAIQTAFSIETPSVRFPSASTAVKRFFSGAAIWFLFALGMVGEMNEAREREAAQKEGRTPRLSKRRSASRVPMTVGEVERFGNTLGAMSLLFGAVSIFLPLPDDGFYLTVFHPLLVLFVGLGLLSIIDLAVGTHRKREQQVPPSVG